MNRSTLLTLVVAGLFAIPMTSTLRADTPTTAPTHQHGKHQQGHPRLEQFKENLAKLDLTADQKTQIDAILADAKTQLQALRDQAKTGGDKTQLREKAKTIVEDAIKKVHDLLTPEQRQKLHELRKEEHGDKPNHHQD